MTRLREFMDDDEQALATSLGTDATAELTAAQLVSAQRVLTRRNWSAINTGQSAEARYPEAVTEARTAFERLGH